LKKISAMANANAHIKTFWQVQQSSVFVAHFFNWNREILMP
jgi:hypothetical protein